MPWTPAWPNAVKPANWQMIAGATAVEVGTANFWDPAAPARIARELDEFLSQEGIARAADLVGTLKL